MSGKNPSSTPSVGVVICMADWPLYVCVRECVREAEDPQTEWGSCIMRTKELLGKVWFLSPCYWVHTLVLLRPPAAHSPSLSSSLQRTAVLREALRILLAVYTASHVGINLSCSYKHYLLSPGLASRATAKAMTMPCRQERSNWAVEERVEERRGKLMEDWL